MFLYAWSFFLLLSFFLTLIWFVRYFERKFWVDVFQLELKGNCMDNSSEWFLSFAVSQSRERSYTGLTIFFAKYLKKTDSIHHLLTFISFLLSSILFDLFIKHNCTRDLLVYVVHNIRENLLSSDVNEKVFKIFFNNIQITEWIIYVHNTVILSFFIYVLYS